MTYNTEKISEDFSSGLRAYISRKVSGRSDIEDILQDVFVNI